MPSVKELLTACGLKTPHEQVRLVRHSDHLGRSIRQVIADGFFEVYQAEQDAKVKPFQNCEVILSFLGIEGNLAEFYGAYRVNGFRDFKAHDFAGAPDYLRASHGDGRSRIWYELEEIPEFRTLRGRLVAQWVSTRGWFQTKDLEVYELLPPGNEVRFPGYQDVVLSWSELKDIIATTAPGRSRRRWRGELCFFQCFALFHHLVKPTIVLKLRTCQISLKPIVSPRGETIGRSERARFGAAIPNRFACLDRPGAVFDAAVAEAGRAARDGAGRSAGLAGGAAEWGAVVDVGGGRKEERSAA